MTRTDIERELLAFVASVLLIKQPIDVDTRLLDSGIVDSFRLLTMLGFIEQRFGVNIAPHEATAELLQSVATIAAAVVARREAR